jgi:hypothetical protein
MAQDYPDAPVDNPYSNFDSAVNSARSAIRYQRRQAAYAEEQRQREISERQKESAKAAAASMAARNKHFKESAKKGGYDKYVYKDVDGALQSGLNETQRRELEITQRNKEQEEVEKESAKIRARYLSHKKENLKTGILSKYEREKAALSMTELDQQVELNEQMQGEKDYADIKKSLEQQRQITAARLEEDRIAQEKYDEADSEYNTANDFAQGLLPKGITVPNAIPEDPKERVELVNSYNARAVAYEERSKALATARKENLETYSQRELEVVSGYEEWLKGGGTPDQIERAKKARNEALVEAQREHIERAYTNNVEAEQLVDVEYKTLQILKPFIEDVSAAHGDMERDRIKELRSGYSDELRQTGADLGSINKEYGAEMQALADKFSNNEITAEELDKTYKSIFQKVDAGKKRQNDLTLDLSARLHQDGGEGLSDVYANGAAWRDAKLPTKDKDGNWQMPITYKGGGLAVSEEKRKGHGNDFTLQNFLNDVKPLKAVANLVGLGVDAAGKGGAFVARTLDVEGDADILTKFQKDNGLTDEETLKAFKDWQTHYGDWESPNEESHRVTSQGDIIFNPTANLLDKEKLREVIKSSTAPEFIKQRMLQPNAIEAIRDYQFTQKVNDVSMASELSSAPAWNDWDNAQLEKDLEKIRSKRNPRSKQA